MTEAAMPILVAVQTKTLTVFVMIPSLVVAIVVVPPCRVVPTIPKMVIGEVATPLDLRQVVALPAVEALKTALRQAVRLNAVSSPLVIVLSPQTTALMSLSPVAPMAHLLSPVALPP